METIKLLYDFFPTAIFTGTSLIFISEDYRVELTEHKESNFCSIGKTPSIIRVKIAKKALNGEFVPGHREDFQIQSLGELANQIDKYIQCAVGQNIREKS